MTRKDLKEMPIGQRFIGIIIDKEGNFAVEDYETRLKHNISRVIGEDEEISDELVIANLWLKKATRNELRAEQRKRGGL